MTTEWLIVLAADGTILATAQGAPTNWIGQRVAEDTALPAEFRSAAVEMLRDFYRSEGSLETSATALSTGQVVRLLALYAVPLRRTATDLARLLHSAIAVMAQQAEAMEVALTIDVAGDIPTVAFVDPEKIAWAVTALVGNALRYVPRGTRLMPGGSIVVRARHDADTAQVVLEVQDDGVGIAEDRLRTLLHRGPGRHHVIGLGLMLVQEIVTAHGGRLEIASRTDADQSGTTVRLRLPYR